MTTFKIQRPNGSLEQAELTEIKDLFGSDFLSVKHNNIPYYAELDSGLSTHMFVIKPDGRKLYVQETLGVLVNFNYTEYGKGVPERLDFSIDNPSPKSIDGITFYSIQKAKPGRDTKVILHVSAFYGTITVKLKNIKAVFKYQNSTSATADVGTQGIDVIRTYAKNTPFRVNVIPG